MANNVGGPPAIHEELTAPDWINNLNNDCLIKIFEYLSLDQRLIIERVCKRWNEVGKLAWDDITKLDFNEYKNVSLGSSRFIGNVLMRCGCHLKELTLHTVYDSKLLPIVGQHCWNLTRLTIHSENVDKNCVKLLPEMQRLTYLKLMVSTSFPKDFFQTLPYETLTEIHLGSSPFMGRQYLPHDFSVALKNLRKLTAITVQWFKLESEVIDVITQKSNLTFLSLQGSRITGEMPHFNPLPNLEHLNLRQFAINDYSLLQILENTPNLKFLDVSDTSNVTDEGLKNLHKLSKLEELMIYGNPSISDRILCRMDNLRKLVCGRCISIHDTGVIELMKHAPNLEFLDLSGTSISEAVLTEAAEITKWRTNNLRLLVYVSSYMRYFWNARINYSHLLKVENEYEDDSDDLYVH